MSKSTEKSILHPAWYEHESGGEITDLNLIDSMDQFFNKIKAIGDLLIDKDKESLAEDTLTNIGIMINDMVKEGDYLVQSWHEQKHEQNKIRIV